MLSVAYFNEYSVSGAQTIHYSDVIIVQTDVGKEKSTLMPYFIR